MASRIQKGVHFAPGETPPANLALVMLDVRREATMVGAADALAAVWSLLGQLEANRPPELQAGPGQEGVVVPDARFTPLIGYGPRLFQLNVPNAVARSDLKPNELGVMFIGQPQLFPRFPWALDIEPIKVQHDIVIQLTAETVLAVARGIVEIERLTRSRPDFPLVFAAAHRGFNRDDRRSWIGFHDGINNMRSDERQAAIEVQNDKAWMIGGTYMAFFKIEVDLEQWRSLPREVQELLVGRDKLSGAPLASADFDADGRITVRPLPECPFNGGRGPVAGGSSGPGDPPQCTDPHVSDPLVAGSHIHRANLLRGSPTNPGSRRIFRQGYEFLDAGEDDKVRVGLNFVGFTRTLNELRNMLRQPPWLGGANFGGGVGAGANSLPDPTFLHVRAAGFFAVPPLKEGEPFPGSALFEPQVG